MSFDARHRPLIFIGTVTLFIRHRHLYHDEANSDNLNQLRKKFADFIQANKQSKYALDIQDFELYKRPKGFSFRNFNPLKNLSDFVNVVYDDSEKSLGKHEQEIVYLKSLMKPYLEKVRNHIQVRPALS